MQVFPEHITARPRVRVLEQHPNGVFGASRVQFQTGEAKAYADGYLTSSETLLTLWQIQARQSFSEDFVGAGRLVFVFHLSGTRELNWKTTVGTNFDP